VRISCILLFVALTLGFSPGAQSQDSPGASVTPDAAPSKAHGGEVLWYGKAPPGWDGVVTRMKLLAPGIGWADRGGRFYWTTDNGANWTDITPPNSPGSDERISDFFFLDTHRGWALFARYDKDQPQFELASTTDAGATWSRTQVSPLPPPADYGNPDRSPLRGWGGKITFADSFHGWLNVTLPGETMNTWWSFLMVTSDGGRTWQQARHAPALADAHALAVSASEGWLFGFSNDAGINVLYVTRDEASSWQNITLSAPKEIAPADCYVMDTPTFEDNTHGFLQVNCSGGSGTQSKLSIVLFATEDGGRTWKPDRMVTNLDDNARNQYHSSTVVGSDWIFAASSEHHPALTKLGPGARIDATADATASRPLYAEIDEVNFATPTQGWAIVGDGYLMSTTDRGATWTALTPGRQPHVIQPHGRFIRRQSMEKSGAAVPQVSVGWGATNSKHLGFDAKWTGTVGEMQAWWEYSPYHDVGVYLNLNGSFSPTRIVGFHMFHDKQLDTPTWVNTVIGYGWGLVPIWGGPQAPVVTKYPKPFFQGISQADRAALSSQTAGILPGGIIYYDMESNARTSSEQVQQFLSGWIQGLHNNGYKAGIYISGVTPSFWNSLQPDAVWVAATGPADGSKHLASIWQLQKADGTLLLQDYQFPNHQRMHQYDDGPCNPDCNGIPKVKWGGVGMNAQFNGGSQDTDLDIEDTWVVGGGVTKPIQVYGEYPFSVFGDCTSPGAVIPELPCNLIAYGISNPQIGTASAQPIGSIVGEITEYPGGGSFIPAKHKQRKHKRSSQGLVTEPCGTYACPVNCDYEYNPNVAVSFDWGFATNYSSKGPLPLPNNSLGVPPASCFDWGGADPGSNALAADINNLNEIAGQFWIESCNPGPDCNYVYYGCKTPTGTAASACSNPVQSNGSDGSNGSYLYFGINDIGWIAARSAPDANFEGSVYLLATNPPTQVPGYSLNYTYDDEAAQQVGINGFGQIAYTDDNSIGMVYDYNGGTYSSGPVQMQAPVVGINNNNDAVTADVTLIQDADTTTGAASPGVPVGCPQMGQAFGINDWGQIVGTATVSTDLSGIEGGQVYVGDVCIPYTGN
jgi:photosystem II stability/assembly factor-like uncharacterized protein